MGQSIISDEMTLEEKLSAIELAVQLAQESDGQLAEVEVGSTVSTPA